MHSRENSYNPQKLLYAICIVLINGIMDANRHDLAIEIYNCTIRIDNTLKRIFMPRCQTLNIDCIL